jgi:universal stress protein A
LTNINDCNIFSAHTAAIRTSRRGLYIVPTYRRILIAVDLTENSVKVAQCGRMLAAALGSELEIVHVVEPLPVSVPIPPEAVVPTLFDTQEHLIEVAQEKLSSLAADPGPLRVRWSVEVGSIKTEILRIAREHHVDLIVLGSREKHGLAFIFGPTEDAVLHAAPCDVLAVRVATS